MEKKIVTLAELKGEKMRLRKQMDEEKPHILLETAKEYSVVLALIDEVESRILRTIAVSIVIALLLFSGCAKTMQGTGLIFEGLGDAVVAGGQHLQESASKE